MFLGRLCLSGKFYIPKENSISRSFKSFVFLTSRVDGHSVNEPLEDGSIWIHFVCRANEFNAKLLLQERFFHVGRHCHTFGGV